MTQAIGGKIAVQATGKTAARPIEERMAGKRAVPTKPGPNSGVPKGEPKGEVSEQQQSKKKKVPISRSPAAKKIVGAKRSWMPHLRPAKSTVRYRQILAAELLVGLFLIVTHNSPTDEDASMDDTVEQLAGFLIVFFILSIMTSGGPSMARLSAAFGGLILVTLLVKENKANDIGSRLIPPKISTPEAGVTDTVVNGIPTVNLPGVR